MKKEKNSLIKNVGFYNQKFLSFLSKVYFKNVHTYRLTKIQNKICEVYMLISVL